MSKRKKADTGRNLKGFLHIIDATAAAISTDNVINNDLGADAGISDLT